MIDFHSHILPEIDDGSGSAAESLQMLEVSARQGVKLIAATPHFYAAESSPEQFLRRRAKSAGMLQKLLGSALPQVLLGAEVCYFDGISRTEALEGLKLELSALQL